MPDGTQPEEKPRKVVELDKTDVEDTGPIDAEDAIESPIEEGDANAQPG